MDSYLKTNFFSSRTTFVSILKSNILNFLGYEEGNEYITNIKPKLKKYSYIELMKIATIEGKLKNLLALNKYYTSSIKGLSETEASLLLEWTVQNAREVLLKGENEIIVSQNKELDKNIKDINLQGLCGLGQALTAFSLRNMGLSPNIVNASKTLVSKYSISDLHAYLTVNIPIEKSGSIVNKLYLVDTTFSQFFIRDAGFPYIKDRKFGNRVTSNAGYWILKMKNGRQFAEELLSKGFIELSEENAKIYGDSFYLSDKYRKNYSKVPSKREMYTGISGKQYIDNIKNPEFQALIHYTQEELEEYTKTPLMQKKELSSHIDSSLVSSNIKKQAMTNFRKFNSELEQ